MKVRAYIGMLACALLLQGCETLGLEKPPAAQGVRKPPPVVSESHPAPATSGKPPAFYTVLADAYAAMAAQAVKDFDWMDAYKFDQKSKRARMGLEVTPDAPETRSAGVAGNGDVRKAYVMLKGYLEPQRVHTAPEDIANAQASYDCWLDEGEESVEGMTKGKCREAFFAAIKKADDKIIDDALDTIEAPLAKAPAQKQDGKKQSPDKSK